MALIVSIQNSDTAQLQDDNKEITTNSNGAGSKEMRGSHH